MYSKIELLVVVFFSLILGYTLILLNFGDLGTAVATTALTGFFGLITNKDSRDAKGKLGLSLQSIVVTVCLTLSVIAVITSEVHVIQVVSIATGALSGFFGISHSNSNMKQDYEKVNEVITEVITEDLDNEEYLTKPTNIDKWTVDE